LKIKKEKYLIYSIVIVMLGWLYFGVIDYLNYTDFISQFKGRLLVCFPRSGKYDTISFKLIAIGFGMVSLYFSCKGKLPNQKKIRVLLIFLSLILIVISSFHFPNFILRYLK
jgi:hypothetical protein